VNSAPLPESFGFFKASVIPPGRPGPGRLLFQQPASIRETPEFEYLLSLLSPVWIVRNTTPVREDLPTRLDVVAIQTERILFQLTSGERNREERKILIARFETGTPNRAAARLFRAHLTSKSADPTRPNKDPVGPWREQ
jgi:hypothetical protein